jgi:plastocyanin
MHRLVALLAVFVAALGLMAGGFALAQDAATPAAGTTDTAVCATPLAEADGTPMVMGTPVDPAAGTPVELVPCATPINPSPVVEGAAEGTTEDPVVGAQSVSVEMIDIAFVPTEITIPADTDVAFIFVNNGVLPHNFTVDSPEVFSGDLTAGQTSELVVNLPAGTYQYYCSVPGHKDTGMVGTLTVQ